MAHEILALQIVEVLLGEPTDDSVEIAVAFVKEVGQLLEVNFPYLWSVWCIFSGVFGAYFGYVWCIRIFCLYLAYTYVIIFLRNNTNQPPHTHNLSPNILKNHRRYPPGGCAPSSSASAVSTEKEKKKGTAAFL